MKTLLLISFAIIPAFAAPQITARQVIERIQKNVGVPWSGQTVDTIKTGNPDTPVTGIATTFAATLDVLKRAAASGKNLIVTHEPTFYNHLDSTKELEGDAVLKAKQDFIEKHGLVIFRFHDHWHMRKPDGIMEGMVRALGWQEYRSSKDPAVFTMPAATLEDLAAGVKKRLAIRTMRVIGDPAMRITKVGFAPGASPSSHHFRLLQRDDVEALVIGEAREWETVEYVRDAAEAGKRKALIIMGHVPSEQSGMEECARWMKTFVSEAPVEFIPASEPFWGPK